MAGPSYDSAADPAANPSIGELTSRVSEQVSTLVRDELALARIELQDKGKRAGVGAGLFGGAAVLAWFGVGCLVAGGIAALALVLSTWAAALVVAGALFVVAGVAALVGKRQVQRAVPPAPTEALAGAKRDVQALKGHHS